MSTEPQSRTAYRFSTAFSLIATLTLGIHGTARAQWCGVEQYAPPKPSAQAPPITPCKECELFCRRSPCLVRNGVYYLPVVDLSLPTAGVPLTLQRSFDSGQAIDAGLGTGWTSSALSHIFYATYLYSAPSTYVHLADVILENGSRQTFTQNPDGSFTQPQGTTNTLVRNADGTFDMTRWPGASIYHFDTDGALLSITDRYSNQITVSYDGSRRVQQIADASGSGRYLDVYWGPNGRISSVNDSAARQVQYGYDTQGRLTSVTDPLGRITHYDYTSGRFGPVLSGIRDNWNRVITTITYDTSGRTSTYTENGETYTYTYSYQGNPNLTTKTDSEGNAWLFTSDANGLVTDDVPPSGSGGAPSHTDFYPDGLIQQQIDQVGAKTYYTYDTLGNVTSLTRDYQGPAPVRFDYAYDPNFPDRLISFTPKDPATGNVNLDWQAQQFDYYQAGGLAPGALFHAYRVESDGITRDTIATYTYDSAGRVLSQLDADGGETDYAYDSQGGLHTVTSPANNTTGTRPVTTYANDALGNVTSVTDPLGHQAAYTYDAAGRVLTVTLPKPSSGSPLDFTTTYSHDNYDSASGLVFTHITDPNGNRTKLGYDQFGRLARSTDAQGSTTAYAYTNDRLTSITDANGNTTSYAYDALKRLTRTTFPDSAYETYTYFPNGNLRTRTDRKDQTTTYGYDWQGRLTSKSYSAGGSMALSYTGQKLTGVTDASVTPNESQTFTYDSAYRVATNTQGLRGTLLYGYSATDRVMSVQVQDGPLTSYSYYPDGSLDTITWSPVSGQFVYGYDLAGRYQSITFPNGQTRTYSYDDQGRLTQLGNALGSTTLAFFGYGYDQNNAGGSSTMLGQRTSATATVPIFGLSAGLTKYSYDSLYQLRKAEYPTGPPFAGEVDSWTYDAIGNRLSSTVNGATQTYSYFKNGTNPLNGQRLQTTGGDSFAYDANGSLQTHSGSTSLAFEYDFENRLSSIMGSTIAGYVYDYRGRRTLATSTSATYVYDGLNAVRESLAGANLDYLFGPGVDELLAVSSDGVITYVDVDGIGSTVAENTSTGVASYATLTDAWGIPRAHTGTQTTSFGFTGRENGDAGLWFYRARYYDPSIGRFTQEDPRGLSQFVPDGALSSRDLPEHPYSYALQDPVLMRDPLGLSATMGGGCVMALGAAGLLIGSLVGATGGVVTSAGVLSVPGAVLGGGVGATVGVTIGYLLCPDACPPIPLAIPRSRRRGWTCEGRCHATPYGTTRGSGYIIKVNGSGPDAGSACQLAMDLAVSMTPPGYYCRHPHCTNCRAN